MQTKKNKPKQGKEKKKTKTQKNPCLQLYTQSQGSGSYLPGNKGLCRDGGVGVGVCVCVCVCVYTAYVNQFSTEWAHRTPKITKVQLATGSSFPWRHLREGLWGKF